MMSNDLIFEPSEALQKSAHIAKSHYERLYKESVSQPEQFWAEHGKLIDWIKPYSIISNCSYNTPVVYIKWYEDGTLNASANCLDRHLKTKANQTAIIWEGDEPSQSKHISYLEPVSYTHLRAHET